MSPRLVILAALVAPLLTTTTVRAQSCAAALPAPADSVTTTFTLDVRAYDTTHPLPFGFSELVADGIRSALRLPRPLALPAFVDAGRAPVAGDSTLRRVSPTLSAMYTVRIDSGHLGPPHRLAGVATTAFDSAVVLAVRAVDSAGDVPPLPDELRTAPVELRLVVERAPERPDSASSAQPLFKARVPLWTLTKNVKKVSPNRATGSMPRGAASPQSAEVEALFGDDGRVDPGSLRVVGYTSLEFAQNVVNDLASWRVEPAQIGECRIPLLERVVTQAVSGGTVRR